jgi:hypothetical protein
MRNKVLRGRSDLGHKTNYTCAERRVPCRLQRIVPMTSVDLTMRISRTLALAFLTAAAAGLCTPAAAQPGYPRLGLYGSVLGGGYPYVKPDFTLDTLEIGRAARYQEVVLDVYPISPYRPDIVQAMKARNPSMTILAYLLAEDIWLAGDADSTHHIPTIIRHTVRDLNGFLYDKVTGLEYQTIAINIAKKDATGRFVVADAMADICRDHIIATHLWDGIFTDIFCHTVSWTQLGTTRVIDYQRAGYASLAALDAAWSEACDTLAARLRQDAGPNFVLVGNCGGSAEHTTYNGWMRENFPFQQGGTWYSNMLGDSQTRGYFNDDRDYRQPSHNWILSASTTVNGQQYDTWDTDKVRYGLASAALAGGVHGFCPTKSVNVAPYQDWWYDEYAVDLTTGRSDELQQHVGWLGQPVGPARTMVWVSGNFDAAVNNSFESNVTSGWTFETFAPAAATIARDATTAAVGTASAKIHISAAGPVDWDVYLATVGVLNVFSGQNYAATFWAKTSSPRLLHAVTGNTGGSAYAAIDTTWRQFQLILTPTTSGLATLGFFVGQQAGDIWLDDVHFQAGASSIWRRDFSNGSVLVNPTDVALDVQMEAPFRRLIGLHRPDINSGVLSTIAHVPGHDALFLLRASLDHTPPAAVNDLRIGP